jgi:ribosomal protein S18 acetylase RimI-like enzyme
VRWAEARWRERAPARDGVSLSVRAYEDDATRIASLEALGYGRAGPAGVTFRLPLDAPLPSAPALPEGIALRDCVGVDVERRAAAHRAAWDHLEHLGIDARSTFDAAAYGMLSGLPPYDPTLDILAETAEGDFVAGCIAWADAASGIAVFEPVGTSLAFRGQRLASAVIGEALRRLQARGLVEARVGTAHFNASAIAAYRACGFKPAGGSCWWSRTLV